MRCPNCHGTFQTLEDEVGDNHQCPHCGYFEEEIECLDAHKGDCQGEVAYHPSIAGTGTMIPRCDYHYEKVLELDQEIKEKYGVDSDVPPSWFVDVGGGYNEYGERWDDDY